MSFSDSVLDLCRVPGKTSRADSLLRPYGDRRVAEVFASSSDGMMNGLHSLGSEGIHCESGLSFREAICSLGYPLAILAAVWGLGVAIVNPVGEFMINDDWCYVRALETLISEGRLGPTGWGPTGAPGGPALVVHLLWGWLFSLVGGFSLTVLRLSVLVAGVLGSVMLLVLLRMADASRWESLWASLTLVLNPLFFSQSFTYMTDITFSALVVVSVLCLYVGVRSGRTAWLAVGLVFCLCSVLTRQIGIVVPAGFLIASFIHPWGKRAGRDKALVLVIGLVVIPWLAYEYALFQLGSTPIIRHQVVVGAWKEMQFMGLPAYLGLLCWRLFGCALVYVGFLTAPVLALRYRSLFADRTFRIFAMVLTAGFVLVEGFVLAGSIDPPVKFLRNVITDFGIGPILLKDVYILGVQRFPTLPPVLYCALVYVAVLAAAALLKLIFSASARVARRRSDDHLTFLGVFALSCGMLYLGVIVLTGFHDRYLIPLCIFFLIWLIVERPPVSDLSAFRRGVAIGLLPLVFMGSFAFAGVHDFMAMKRAQKESHDYLLNTLRADPCRCDGGMEFNGYWCYQPDFRPVEGLSWWWVSHDEFLITLGPLPGYKVVRTFPFERLLGGSAAIHILKRSGKAQRDQPANMGKTGQTRDRDPLPGSKP